jgi:hypothetical protein
MCVYVCVLPVKSVCVSGLCSDGQMVRYNEYGTDHLFVEDERF